MLGATAYQLLAGRLPITGTSLPEVIVKIRRAIPEPPSKYRPGLPAAFEAAVLKLLAKQPAQRYQTAGELLTELNAIARAAQIRI